MKGLICLLLCVVALGSALVKKPHYDLKDAKELFDKFIKDHGRHYKDSADWELHFIAFRKTLEAINSGNDNNPDAVFDINEFADYTPEEQKRHMGLKIDKPVV